MKLSAPKVVTFLVSLIAGGIVIVSKFVTIPVLGAILAAYGFWILAGAFVLLILATMFKGL